MMSQLKDVSACVGVLAAKSSLNAGRWSYTTSLRVCCAVRPQTIIQLEPYRWAPQPEAHRMR